MWKCEDKSLASTFIIIIHSDVSALFVNIYFLGCYCHWNVEIIMKLQSIKSKLLFYLHSWLVYSKVLNKRPGPNNRPGWKRDQKLIAVQGQIDVQGKCFWMFLICHKGLKIWVASQLLSMVKLFIDVMFCGIKSL